MERHIINGIYIFDCKICGHVFRATDSKGEFRSSTLTKFIRVWRRLEPNVNYLLASLADAIGTSLEVLKRLINRVYGESIDGKPTLTTVYGIKEVFNERTGRVDLIYTLHPAVLKDLDPTEGEPWPYDIFDIKLIEYQHGEPIINRSLLLKVWVEYCFTSPTEVFIGIEHEKHWVACTQERIFGEGVKEFTLEIPPLKKYGRVDIRVRAFYRGQDWIEGSSLNVKIDFSRVECDACGRLLSFDKSFSEVRCLCGRTLYKVGERRAYMDLEQVLPILGSLVPITVVLGVIIYNEWSKQHS
jgi:ribosomal protein S27E